MVAQIFSVFCGTGGIGKEDGEGGRILPDTKGITPQHLSLTDHATPSRSQHVPTPLLFKVRCWLGFWVLFLLMSSRQDKPSLMNLGL